VTAAKYREAKTIWPSKSNDQFEWSAGNHTTISNTKKSDGFAYQDGRPD